MTHTPDAPDWPPRDSAWEYPEGTQKYGSTGQLFEVRNKQWVRVKVHHLSADPLIVESPPQGGL